jgi:hypothetical protein
LNGFIIIVLLFLNALSTPATLVLIPYTAYLSWSKFDTTWFALALLVNFAFSIFLVTSILKSCMRIHTPLAKRGGLRIAPDPLQDEFRRAAFRGATTLDFPVNRIRTYLDYSCQTVRLAALRDGEFYALVVSPSAIVKLRHTPDQMTAALAHEVAHFEQGDCDLWPYGWCVLDQSIRYSLPFNLVFVPTVIWCHLNLQPIPPTLVESPVSTYAIVPVSLLIYSFLLRRTRRMSETCADLAAVLSGQGDGLLNYLNSITGHTDPLAWFRVHPSLQTRKKSISRWVASLPTYTDDTSNKDASIVVHALEMLWMITKLMLRSLVIAIAVLAMILMTSFFFASR